jgi:hypothetical protein
LSDFYTVNLLFYPLIHTVLFGRKSLYVVTFKEQGVIFHFLDHGVENGKMRSFETILRMGSGDKGE